MIYKIILHFVGLSDCGVDHVLLSRFSGHTSSQLSA